MHRYPLSCGALGLRTALQKRLDPATYLVPHFAKCGCGSPRLSDTGGYRIMVPEGGPSDGRGTVNRTDEAADV
jgi:hypothetical protein